MSHADASIGERRDAVIDYVMVHLDYLKGSLQDIFDAIDPPFKPPREFDVPDGGESALEAIADAIFAAERRWAHR